MATLNTAFPTLVLNTTVLSNFLQAHRAEWLQQLGVPVAACPTVLQELEIGIQRGKIPRVPLEWLMRIELQPVEATHAETLRLRLGAGEAESVAVALSRGWGFATDDRLARRVAQQLGVRGLWASWRRWYGERW
ncbi:MAG: hypothetical protein NZL85_09020 [Fimbriimonadales bacterium]|nr:hypothetical protein [Fimbriimonadales bacterium]